MQDLAPVLEPLLSALFSAFLKPDSAENEYVMRCIMRVIDFVGPEVRSTPLKVVTLLQHSDLIGSRCPFVNFDAGLSFSKHFTTSVSTMCYKCRLRQLFHHVYLHLLESRVY